MGRIKCEVVKPASLNQLRYSILTNIKIWWLFIFLHQKILKQKFKLCGEVEISLRILCSGIQVLNVGIKDFWCKDIKSKQNLIELEGHIVLKFAPLRKVKVRKVIRCRTAKFFFTSLEIRNFSDFFLKGTVIVTNKYFLCLFVFWFDLTLNHNLIFELCQCF